MRARTPISARGGFSLLEVLVASAVLAIVLMILLGVLSATLNIWRATEGKTQADREARAAELVMVQDLANILVPADPALWPRLQNEHLQFLTRRPVEYQSEEGDLGNVIFVEYFFDHGIAHRLTRAFLGSRETFEKILQTASFPAPGDTAGQVLAENILPQTADAVRGLAVAQEANNTNFIFLGPGLLPLTGPLGPNNFPSAIEVNFAVADMEGIDNLDLLDNPDYLLRNAGLYSFRVFLPPPSESLPPRSP